MDGIFSRNELIWGESFQKELALKHVLVAGLGGVGGAALEALVRAGIGEVTIIDFDEVSLSNVNRQIIALNSTLGKKKTAVFEKRLRDINPELKINVIDDFYTNEINSFFGPKTIDYALDAIDTLKSKIELIEFFYNSKTPLITSLGAGNRLDPTKLKIGDISQIQQTTCPFAKRVLHILKSKNITTGIKCVYSTESPVSKRNVKTEEKIQTKCNKTLEITKVSPGSTPFVPVVCGYYMAFEIINNFYEISTLNG